MLKLGVNQQSCVEIHFAVEAHGSLSAQNKVVRLQGDVIDLDPLVVDGQVEPRFAELEQLKLVDLEQFAQLAKKVHGLERRRNEFKASRAGHRGGAARIARKIDRALQSSFSLARFELRIFRQLPQAYAAQLQPQQERVFFVALDPVFSRKFSSCKRALNVRHLQNLSIPGELPANLSRLERAKKVRLPDLEDSGGGALRRDLPADVQFIQRRHRPVLRVQKDDASAPKAKMLQFRLKGWAGRGGARRFVRSRR